MKGKPESMYNYSLKITLWDNSKFYQQPYFSDKLLLNFFLFQTCT